MIILDLNQTMISNLMASLGNHTNIKIEEDLLRHMVLNTIKSHVSRFKPVYGELVIACDDSHYWRKDIFPYYKASRKRDREKSELDWASIFKILNKIRDELKEYFPYRVIQVERAEADDVIATLCHTYGHTDEKILILSADKDFKQLHIYNNVVQYDPIRKKYLTEANPEVYLKEHILKGDRGDGIPNFLSRDDTFVVGSRQKPVRQSKLDIWVTQEPEAFCDSQTLRNYERNRQLIDLKCIPLTIQRKIIDAYNQEESKLARGKSQLFNYFIANKLKHLVDELGQF